MTDQLPSRSLIETPRTDAEHARLLEADYGDAKNPWEVAFLLMRDFARELERDLSLRSETATSADAVQELRAACLGLLQAGNKAGSKDGITVADLDKARQRADAAIRAIKRSDVASTAPSEIDARLNWISGRAIESLSMPTREELAAFTDGFRAGRTTPSS